jgi:thioredoxin-like negative regulator of GroEL
MYKSQIALVAAAAVLVVALFVFGERTTPFEMPNQQETTINEEAIEVDFNKIVASVKNKLNQNARDSVESIEKMLVKTVGDKTKQSEYLNSLSEIWGKQQYPEIAAFYANETAKKDSVLKNWKNAAQKSATAFRVAHDSTKLKNYFVDKAIYAYQNVLNIDSNDVDAKLDMATCYIDGKPQQPMIGILMIREIAEKDTTNFKANYLLARLSMMSGQFDKAVARLKRVRLIDPTNYEPLLMLSDAYLSLNQKENAIDALKDCKKLLKNPNFAAAIEEQINRIKNDTK